jgi:periplasmic divalent cation tolerance protein
MTPAAGSAILAAVVSPHALAPRGLMSDFLIVSTTAATKEDAARISRAVLEPRLAACVQIVGPVTSSYWWQDKLEESEEWLCLIKTSMAHYPELEQAVRGAHKYENPELVAVTIAAGSEAYLKWLGQELA